jgi:cell wall-associated NlpC family hydrolase
MALVDPIAFGRLKYATDHDEEAVARKEKKKAANAKSNAKHNKLRKESGQTKIDSDKFNKLRKESGQLKIDNAKSNPIHNPINNAAASAKRRAEQVAEHNRCCLGTLATDEETAALALQLLNSTFLEPPEGGRCSLSVRQRFAFYPF